MHSIELTEATYRHLSERAARLHLTPEQLIEQLLAALASNSDDLAMPPAGSEEALVAVGRLSGLFADITIPNLDEALADPQIALANAGLDALPR